MQVIELIEFRLSRNLKRNAFYEQINTNYVIKKRSLTKS